MVIVLADGFYENSVGIIPREEVESLLWALLIQAMIESDGLRPSRKEVIFVTVLRERLVTEVTRMPTRRSHVTEWVLGTIGVLAAGVGAWMHYVPADWFLGGLAVGWYYGMFIAAGLLLAAAFGIYAWKSHVDNPEWSVRTVVPTVLALAALAGATMFTVLWMTDQAQIEYSSPERARVVGQAETEYFSPERARIVNGS